MVRNRVALSLLVSITFFLVTMKITGSSSGNVQEEEEDHSDLLKRQQSEQGEGHDRQQTGDRTLGSSESSKDIRRSSGNDSPSVLEEGESDNNNGDGGGNATLSTISSAWRRKLLGALEQEGQEINNLVWYELGKADKEQRREKVFEGDEPGPPRESLRDRWCALNCFDSRCYLPMSLVHSPRESKKSEITQDSLFSSCKANPWYYSSGTSFREESTQLGSSEEVSKAHHHHHEISDQYQQSSRKFPFRLTTREETACSDSPAHAVPPPLPTSSPSSSSHIEDEEGANGGVFDDERSPLSLDLQQQESRHWKHQLQVFQRFTATHFQKWYPWSGSCWLGESTTTAKSQQDTLVADKQAIVNVGEVDEEDDTIRSSKFVEPMTRPATEERRERAEKRRSAKPQSTDNDDEDFVFSARFDKANPGLYRIKNFCVSPVTKALTGYIPPGTRLVDHVDPFTGGDDVQSLSDQESGTMSATKAFVNGINIVRSLSQLAAPYFSGRDEEKVTAGETGTNLKGRKGKQTNKRPCFLDTKLLMMPILVRAENPGHVFMRMISLLDARKRAFPDSYEKDITTMYLLLEGLATYEHVVNLTDFGSTGHPEFTTVVTHSHFAVVGGDRDSFEGLHKDVEGGQNSRGEDAEVKSKVQKREEAERQKREKLYDSVSQKGQIKRSVFSRKKSREFYLKLGLLNKTLPSPLKPGSTLLNTIWGEKLGSDPRLQTTRVCFKEAVLYYSLTADEGLHARNVFGELVPSHLLLDQSSRRSRRTATAAHALHNGFSTSVGRRAKAMKEEISLSSQRVGERSFQALRREPSNTKLAADVEPKRYGESDELVTVRTPREVVGREIASLYHWRSGSLLEVFNDRLRSCSSSRSTKEGMSSGDLRRRPHPGTNHLIFSVRSRSRRFTTQPLLISQLAHFLDQRAAARRKTTQTTTPTSWRMTVVEVSQLSQMEQVRLFTDADIVIGMYGAGLFHGIFMPPGGVIIELNYNEKSCSAFSGLNHPKNRWCDYGGNSYAVDVHHLVLPLGSQRENMRLDGSIDVGQRTLTHLVEQAMCLTENKISVNGSSPVARKKSQLSKRRVDTDKQQHKFLEKLYQPCERSLPGEVRNQEKRLSHLHDSDGSYLSALIRMKLGSCGQNAVSDKTLRGAFSRTIMEQAPKNLSSVGTRRPFSSFHLPHPHSTVTLTIPSRLEAILSSPNRVGLIDTLIAMRQFVLTHGKHVGIHLVIVAPCGVTRPLLIEASALATYLVPHHSSPQAALSYYVNRDDGIGNETYNSVFCRRQRALPLSTDLKVQGCFSARKLTMWTRKAALQRAKRGVQTLVITSIDAPRAYYETDFSATFWSSDFVTTFRSYNPHSDGVHKRSAGRETGQRPRFQDIVALDPFPDSYALARLSGDYIPRLRQTFASSLHPFAGRNDFRGRLSLQVLVELAPDLLTSENKEGAAPLQLRIQSQLFQGNTPEVLNSPVSPETRVDVATKPLPRSPPNFQSKTGGKSNEELLALKGSRELKWRRKR